MVHIFRHQLDKDTSISLPAKGKSKPTLVLGLGPVFLHIPLEGDAKTPYISFPGSSVQVENNFNIEHHVNMHLRKQGYKEKRARYDDQSIQWKGARQRGTQGSKKGQKAPDTSRKVRSGVYYIPGVPGVGKKPKGRHLGEHG